MNIKSLIRSFAGGEIAPEMFGRLDLAKFQTALSLCRNFVTLAQGPAQNRAGFSYVLETKFSAKKSRLISFSYSTQQTFILEFGDLYVRFHTAGGTLLETGKAITAITQANPGVFTSAAHGFANGNWVFAAAIGGMTALNGRWFIIANATANTFTLTDLFGNAINTTGLPAYTAGGMMSRVYEVVTPYLEADLFRITHVQSADVLTLCHPSYPPAELRRLGATNWTLTNISFAPTIATPVPAVKGNAKGSDYFYNYVVTALASDGINESAPSGPATGVARSTITGITQANPGVITVSAAHGLSLGQSIYIDSVNGMGELNKNNYSVNTIPTGSSLTLKDLSGAVVDTTAFGAYTSGGKIYLGGVINNLFVTGGANTVSWAVVAGASAYNVYKKVGGQYGYVGQTQGTVFVDDNITADLSKTPPSYPTLFQAVDDYPSAVSYFEQRRCFGGSNNKPQNLWMTRSGTETALSSSSPTRDDDAIAIRVAAREVNYVRHIVPLGDLLLLTSGGEWRVTSVNSDAITPASISVRPQGYIGANFAQPIVTNTSVLYAQSRGGHIRELAYSWEQQGYQTNDMSILAPHLFDDLDILDLAWVISPHHILWAISSNGTMLSMTYVPEQQVAGWHRHDTDGAFESVAAVAEGTEDALYVVVNRTINGVTKRYVERMHTRQFDTPADAFFVDSGLTYNGAPAAAISGLHHLEGETVSILGDGAVVPQAVVANGAIALAQPVSKAQIGLPITADIQTLPLALEAEAAGQANKKNVNEVYLRVKESSGIFAGPSFDKLTEYKQRTNEPYGSPPSPVTGVVKVVVQNSWGDDAVMCIRQSDPLPLTITSMVLKVAVGG